MVTVNKSRWQRSPADSAIRWAGQLTGRKGPVGFLQWGPRWKVSVNPRFRKRAGRCSRATCTPNGFQTVFTHGDLDVFGVSMNRALVGHGTWSASRSASRRLIGPHWATGNLLLQISHFKSPCFWLPSVLTVIIYAAVVEGAANFGDSEASSNFYFTELSCDFDFSNVTFLSP